jgi:hypothetical protein
MAGLASALVRLASMDGRKLLRWLVSEPILLKQFFAFKLVI